MQYWLQHSLIQPLQLNSCTLASFMSLLFDVPDKLQIICNTLAASSVPQAPCALYATCLDSRLAPRCHHNPLCAYHIAQIWASARVPTARFPGEGPGLFVNFETLAQLDAVQIAKAMSPWVLEWGGRQKCQSRIRQYASQEAQQQEQIWTCRWFASYPWSTSDSKPTIVIVIVFVIVTSKWSSSPPSSSSWSSWSSSSSSSSSS